MHVVVERYQVANEIAVSMTQVLYWSDLASKPHRSRSANSTPLVR